MTIFNHEDILNFEKYFRISFMNKISGLRSANLISTLSPEGVANVAIFNSVTHIGATPPFLGFVMRPLTVERQTYEYIKHRKYFTINQITPEIHKKAHWTSAKFPANVSEFEACGLTDIYIDDFPIPFVKESPIKIGLSFEEEHLIKANQTILMVGKIEKVIINDNVVQPDGDINYEEIGGVSIGGLDTYYEVKRLGYYKFARPNKKVEKM